MLCAASSLRTTPMTPVPRPRPDHVTRDDGPTSEARQPTADVNEPGPDYDEPVRGAGQRDDAVPDSGAGAIRLISTPVRSYRAPRGRAATRQTTTVAKRRVEPLRSILL